MVRRNSRRAPRGGGRLKVGRRPQGGAAGGGARARPDGPRMRVPQLARCSRDQLRRRMGQYGPASMALRSDVVEAAAGRRVSVRSSDEVRAPPSLGRQIEARHPASRTQSRLREHGRWSTHYSPRAHVSLTRRLRRAVAVWPEEPGLTPAPTLLPPFFARRRGDPRVL